MKKKVMAIFMAFAMTLGIVSPAFAAGLSSAEQNLLSEFKTELDYWNKQAGLDPEHISQYYAQAEKALNAVDLTDAACSEFSGVIKDVHNLLGNASSKSELWSHYGEIADKINAVGAKYYKLHVTVDAKDKYATVTWEIDGKTSTAANTGKTVKQTGFGLAQTAAVAGGALAVLVGTGVVARKKQLFRA